MGNKHSRHSDKHAEFEKKYGCSHYDDNTIIKHQRWKTVPMTHEESKMVLRRMKTICESTCVDGTTGLKKSKSMTTHDAIEFEYYCQKCKGSRFITIELWPSGEIARSGKYTKVIKTREEKRPKDLNMGKVETTFKDFKDIRYDILNGRRSAQKFCEEVWGKLMEA
uniref:Uncharacterized protein n=1 Tax=Euplotes crassus TaxID=5936 RepID=A0A7S3NS79_EUPCR|mmetsp:Transcript_15674/g.15470  ORF Transcript_15674/g.15470 Transcript_15674/m.15470 type:complete len:166 (+) Transcript_15674:46-543(+)